MKIIKNYDKIIIYLFNEYLKIDFTNINTIKQALKKVLLHINNIVEIYGYYNAKIYKDNNYGVIIELEKEDYDFFDRTIDLDIKVIEDEFLFELDENIGNCYYYEEKFYYKKNSKNIIDFIEFANKIIYGNNAKKIKKKAKVIL